MPTRADIDRLTQQIRDLKKQRYFFDLLKGGRGEWAPKYRY